MIQCVITRLFPEVSWLFQCTHAQHPVRNMSNKYSICQFSKLWPSGLQFDLIFIIYMYIRILSPKLMQSLQLETHIWYFCRSYIALVVYLINYIIMKFSIHSAYQTHFLLKLNRSFCKLKYILTKMITFNTL